MPLIDHRTPRQDPAAHLENPVAAARKSAWCQGLVYGALTSMLPATTLAASILRDSPTALAAWPSAVQHTIEALALPSAGWGHVARSGGNWLSASLGQISPATLYATRMPDKGADALSAAVDLVLDRVPWSQVRDVVWRLPGAAYPAACNWQAPGPLCPDPMAYQRAAAIAPHFWAANSFLVITVTGAVALGLAYVYLPGVIAAIPEDAVRAFPLPSQFTPWALHLIGVAKKVQDSRLAAATLAQEQADLYDDDGQSTYEDALDILSFETASERSWLLAPVQNPV